MHNSIRNPCPCRTVALIDSNTRYRYGGSGKNPSIATELVCVAFTKFTVRGSIGYLFFFLQNYYQSATPTRPILLGDKASGGIFTLTTIVVANVW